MEKEKTYFTKLTELLLRAVYVRAAGNIQFGVKQHWLGEACVTLPTPP